MYGEPISLRGNLTFAVNRSGSLGIIPYCRDHNLRHGLCGTLHQVA